MKNEYLEAIVESLKKNKNDVAIVDKNKSYSYNDVYSLALKTANYLKDLKLDNHIIPIMLDSGYEYIAINLGIWLLGYTAVPMGLSFPLDRVEYILSETKASILIDNDKLKEILKADEIKSYEIVSDDTLALIIYTSGSTGNPKGIMQTFRGLNKKQTFKYDKNDAYLALAPFYFVASLTNFKILRDGAKLHIPLNDVKLDIKKIEKYVCDNNITHMFIPPSVLKNFTNKSKSLKVVYTGSEKLTNEESRDGYTLINCYGMTETLGTVSSFKVNKKYDATPVGKPEYEWCLLDDDGKKVSKGSLGELCIKGNFTIGYFNDPVKTKELIDENGFYHTKDLLRELPSGDLVYVNRKDWMVKINGQRVEVGEVETRIKDVEGIQQAVVKGFENKEGGAYLCAFYKGDVKDTDIKEYLSKLLPPYMIPLFFVKVKDFSYLTNGKSIERF